MIPNQLVGIALMVTITKTASPFRPYNRRSLLHLLDHNKTKP